MSANLASKWKPTQQCSIINIATLESKSIGKEEGRAQT